jgi:hypothetical protein
MDVSPPDLPEWTTITAMDVSHHRKGTVYVSGQRHRLSDRGPCLSWTGGCGRIWERITNGTRENDYSGVIREIQDKHTGAGVTRHTSREGGLS